MRIQVKLMLNKNKINNCQIKIKTETEYLNYNVKAFQSIAKKIKKNIKKTTNRVQNHYSSLKFACALFTKMRLNGTFLYLYF